jgi:multiple sugar transport system substrate-binding protein
MRARNVWFFLLVPAVAAAFFLSAVPVKAETVLTLWSHWADHDSKRNFVEDAARAFEATSPGVKVKVGWYEKTALYASLKTALRAGQAPDIFYAEPNQVEYMENNLLYDLSKGLKWDSIEGWAKDVWSYKDGVYGFPLEAWTIELYYDKKLLAEMGFKLPPHGQFKQHEFLDLVKKTRAKGITPISLGVGDRPYPGAFLTHEALLKKLGLEDYDKLLKGNLGWGNSRVVDALRFVKQLIDAKALPSSFSTLKLGESHFYFHTKPGALMFLMGSFYPSRAFNPPDKGGQPLDFQLGIMQYPALDDAVCNECKTITVGGSYVVNAASKNPEIAIKFLNSMATPEMGNKWLEAVLVQTGIKTDPSKIKGPYAEYFRELAKANEANKYYTERPMTIMRGKAREVFTQVVNHAFPAGLLSVDEVVEKMNATQK